MYSSDTSTQGAAPAPPQRVRVGQQVIDAAAPSAQAMLAAAHASGARPTCLCRPDGVPMYVARHGHYLVKRMPGTGPRHHAACPSFEPEADSSGLGALLGRAIVERDAEQLQVKVRFSFGVRAPGAVAASAEPEAGPALGQPAAASDRAGADASAQISAPRTGGLSLRALTHLLFDKAGLNRWSPAMEQRRSQATLHKFLTLAAQQVHVAGEPLATRLFVPEPYVPEQSAALAARRRQALCRLYPDRRGASRMLLLGELRDCLPHHGAMRLRLRHMPDCPLQIGESTWRRFAARARDLLAAAAAPEARPPRLLLALLIRARREQIFEIDALAALVASRDYLPADSLDELPLINALVRARRRFVKPLRYDAPHGGRFPSILLLDTGVRPTPLYVLSPFAPQAEREAKEALLAEQPAAWLWRTGDPLPALPSALDGAPGPSGRRGDLFDETGDIERPAAPP